MAKNKLLGSTKIDGGVQQAEFLYSTLYDISHSQISDAQLDSCVAFVGSGLNPNYP